MKFILSLLLLLTATASATAGAQTLLLEKTEPSAYGYPMTALPGSERREWIQPIFERDHVTAWSADSTGVTFTVPGNHLQAGDTVRLDHFTSTSSFTQNFCTIKSADANSFFIAAWLCNAGLPISGSATETTGLVSVVDGPSRNSNGTWEVYTTTGSESFYLMSKNKARFSGSGSCSLQKAVAHDSSCYAPHPILTHEMSGAGVYIEVGSQPGACTFTGAIATSNLQIHSSVEFDVKFTSDQDTSKSHIEHYVLCANGAGSGHAGVVHVDPGYIQLYKGQSIPLFASVFGSADQKVNWTIKKTDHLSGPADATLDFANSLEPVFTAGQSGGGYVLEACMQEDDKACEDLRIWVAQTQSKPKANLDKVLQFPCEVDSLMKEYGGEAFEVGPGQTYSDLTTLPLNTNSWHWGATVRLHNEASTAGAPVTWNQYFGVNPPANAGPGDGSVPYIHICGIPNPTSGELPIMDGTNSTGASWLSTWTQAGVTMLEVSGSNTDYGAVYNGVDLFARGILVSGIRFQNVNPKVSYVRPDGSASHFGGSSSVRMYGTQHFTVAGTRSVLVAMPYFSDCNTQQAGWRNCSLDGYWLGNHCEGYGISGQPTEHCFYEQSMRTYILANYEEGSASGSGGATGYYSMRGTRSVYAYNFGKPKDPYNSGSGPGGDSEIQDAYMYFAPDAAFGPQGLPLSAYCSLGDTSAPFCPSPANVKGGVDTYAAFQEEHFHTFFNFSNVTFMNSGSTLTGISPTHDVEDLRVSVNEYVYHNTNRTNANFPISLFEDLRNFRPQNYGTPSQPVQWPAAEFQNNDLWNNNNRNCSYGSCAPHGKWSSTTMINYHTNVVRDGQYTIASGITPKLGTSAGINPNGLNTYWDYHDFGGASPIEAHIGGWDNSNFIALVADPINATTLAPEPGSPDVGAASELVWPMNWYPPRFNSVNANMNWTKRVDLSVAGANDAVGAPIPVSFSITPNPISLLKKTSLTLACTTKLSDGTSRDCFSLSCTSNNTASLTVSGESITATATVGSGSLSCTADSLSPVTIDFETHSPPPVPLTISANNVSRAYGAPNPTFTGAITGKVNDGDNLALSFTTTATATSNAGTYPIVPSISGDDLDDYTITVTNGTLTVTKAPVALSLSAPSQVIQGNTATLTVSVPSGATGTVTFYDAGVSLGTAPIASGKATLSVSSLTVGSHNITATYNGDNNFAASNSTVAALSVSKATLTATITKLNAPSSVASGGSATLKATLTTGATGTVTFFDGGATIGSATLVGNTATLTFSPSTAGAHSMTASYSGDTSFAASKSSSTLMLVTAATRTASTVTLSAPSSVAAGSSAILQAMVTSGATGVVTFYDGGVALGTSTVTGGTATLTITPTTAGAHSITSTYGGDNKYVPSSSAAVSINVTATLKADFSVTNQTPTQSVQQGTAANFAIVIRSVNQPFTEAVTLSAENLPAGATYSYSPVHVTPGESGASSNLSIRVPGSSSPATALERGLHTPLIFAAFLFPFRPRRSRKQNRLPRWIALTLASFTAIGCGSSGFSSAPRLQSHTVTVNVSSGNVVHSTTAELVVL